MIDYNYETQFVLEDQAAHSAWINKVLTHFNKKEGEINFVFCDDEYLLEINRKYLSHDDYTDVISFDYSVGNQINGDVFISIERVIDNANTLGLPFKQELKRVMIHGILHYCGLQDKTAAQKIVMREEEDKMINLF